MSRVPPVGVASPSGDIKKRQDSGSPSPDGDATRVDGFPVKKGETAAFLCLGFPPNKKTTRQDRGTPTQLICRGAPRGYPESRVSTKYVQTGAGCE